MNEIENNNIDTREIRKVRAWCNASKQEILLKTVDEAKLNKREISYNSPNNIALSLNIAITHSRTAKQYYENVLFEAANCSSQETICPRINHPEIFDYFERLQISVIFAFTAVETFANIAVPDNYTYERITNKGIKELLTKENIERWCSTTEKLEKILPNIFSMDSPKKAKFWTSFKQLEELRNDIVHPKCKAKTENIPTDYLKRFFDPSIFDIIDAARLVLNYFCDGRSPLPYFPYVIGVEGPVVKLASVSTKLSEHITEIETKCCK
jgi:hypothetical protein